MIKNPTREDLTRDELYIVLDKRQAEIERLSEVVASLRDDKRVLAEMIGRDQELIEMLLSVSGTLEND